MVYIGIFILGLILGILITIVLKNNSVKENLDLQNTVSSVLKPFKDDINSFRRDVFTLNKNIAESNIELATKVNTKLETEVNNLRVLQKNLSDEASRLTNALKGNVKRYGAWGEMILEKVLDISGLEKNKHYEIQKTYIDDGERKIPDCIVRLPENREIVIDSKLSLGAYSNYVNSEDEQSKKLYLEELKTNIMNRVKELADKDYKNINEINSLDGILLFIPVEGLFSIISNNFEDLVKKAAERKIYFTSPLTLIPILNVIERTWQVDKQNKNSKVIAVTAGKIYDKLVGIFEDFDNLSKKIYGIEKDITAIFTKFKGRDSIVSNMVKIEKLGAEGSKHIPAKYEEDYEDSDKIIELKE